MAQNTKISWCDHTANIWHGCEHVHEGCDNCYAEKMNKRWTKHIDGKPIKQLNWGANSTRKEVKSVWEKLDQWQKEAAKTEHHKTGFGLYKAAVFVGSMMDICEDDKPMTNIHGQIDKNATTANVRFHLFYRIDRGDYPNLLFLFLTKRPQNYNHVIFESWKTNPPANVMFGASVSTQKTYNSFKNKLLCVNGKRFLSIEPQIEQIVLGDTHGID